MTTRTRASFFASLALLLSLMLAGPALPASAHGIVDQEFTAGATDRFEQFTGPFTSGAGVNATGGAAQSFVAQFSIASGLVAAEAFLVPNGGAAIHDIPLTANIRSGTRFGPILATATLTIPAGSVGTLASPYRALFRFGATVPLTPNATYFFEIEPDGGLLGWAVAQPVYPGGYLYGQFCQGATCGAFDAGFMLFGPYTNSVGINATGGAAQGFTPTQSNVVGADALLSRGFARAFPWTLTAHIIQGTRFGTVLATTHVTIPAGGAFGFTPIHFDFSPAVPVTPGQPYFFQIDPEGGIFGWAGTFGDPYPGGEGYQGDSSISGQLDLAFRTYYAIDVTPPVVTCAQPDAAWHATDQSFGCTATDAGIGLANPADASFSLATSVPAGTETATAQTGSRTVCDGVGNCAQAGPLGPVLVDRKAPQVAVTSPSGAYVLGSAATAAYSCTDGGSGVATCAGPVANGGAVDTSAPGSFTFAVTGTDAVGNGASASQTYAVSYAVCPPEDDDARTPSGHKRIELHLALCDANGRDVSSRSVTVTALDVTDGTLIYPAKSAREHDATTAFRFEGDDEDAHYAFALDVGGIPAGTYHLRFSVSGDPATHQVAIIVK